MSTASDHFQLSLSLCPCHWFFRIRILIPKTTALPVECSDPSPLEHFPLLQSLQLTSIPTQRISTAKHCRLSFGPCVSRSQHLVQETYIQQRLLINSVQRFRYATARLQCPPRKFQVNGALIAQPRDPGKPFTEGTGTRLRLKMHYIKISGKDFPAGRNNIGKSKMS